MVSVGLVANQACWKEIDGSIHRTLQQWRTRKLIDNERHWLRRWLSPRRDTLVRSATLKIVIIVPCLVRLFYSTEHSGPVMARSCDNWCHLHISVAHVDGAWQYLHRLVIAERTPQRGRPIPCYTVVLRSIYEMPAYVAEKTIVAGADSCEHRKVIATWPDAGPSRTRFFAEIKQTAVATAETLGLAMPDGETAHDAYCPLNPFPSDVDALCYIASYKDLIVAFGDDAKQARPHYENKGRRERRAIVFDPLCYIASHSDLFVFGTDRMAACRHFIRHGHREMRPITFDPFAYLAANPDLIGSVAPDEEQIVEHYIKTGHAAGRRCRAFPWKRYFQANPELRKTIAYSPESALGHYVRTGYAEGRRVA